MYRDILVPVDGSEGARRGVATGLDIARRYGSRVHVLFVVDERFEGGKTALSSDELYLERVEEEGMETLAEIEDDARERGIECLEACVRGRPAEEIVRYAEDNDVDLIVLGSHGARARERPHRGPVIDDVCRTTAIPVQVV